MAWYIESGYLESRRRKWLDECAELAAPATPAMGQVDRRTFAPRLRQDMSITREGDCVEPALVRTIIVADAPALWHAAPDLQRQAGSEFGSYPIEYAECETQCGEPKRFISTNGRTISRRYGCCHCPSRLSG